MNRRMAQMLVLLGIVTVFSACSSTEPARPDAVRQVSTLDALIDGVYESEVSVGRFTGPTMIGLGTPNQIDGEMIILGRQAYRVDDTGTVYRMKSSTRTPFTVAAPFVADAVVELGNEMHYAELKKRADQVIDSTNYIHAIRLRGSFSSMKVRSVPRQEPPYRPLTEVIKNQQEEFTYESVEGVLVGFRFPSYMNRLNAPGYHLHFLSADREKGGHVLGFTMEKARLELDRERAFEMLLPGHQQFREADLSTHKEEAVESVEKQ